MLSMPLILDHELILQGILIHLVIKNPTNSHSRQLHEECKYSPYNLVTQVLEQLNRVVNIQSNLLQLKNLNSQVKRWLLTLCIHSDNPFKQTTNQPLKQFHKIRVLVKNSLQVNHKEVLLSTLNTSTPYTTSMMHQECPAIISHPFVLKAEKYLTSHNKTVSKVLDLGMVIHSGSRFSKLSVRRPTKGSTHPPQSTNFLFVRFC